MLPAPKYPVPDICTVICGPSEHLPISYALKVHVGRVDTPLYANKENSLWRYKMKVCDDEAFPDEQTMVGLGGGMLHVMKDAPASVMKLFKGHTPVLPGSTLLLMGVSGQRSADGTMGAHMLTTTATAVLLRW